MAATDGSCKAHELPDVPAPTVAMGLSFANPIGLAAGIDRTGKLLSTLSRLYVGHLEIGTITSANDLDLDPRAAPANFRIGINFGSARAGIADGVIDDYVTLMAAAWDKADYLVANLTAPGCGRTGDTPGLAALLTRLGREKDRLAQRTGRCPPLLAKISPGSTTLPAALTAALRFQFDGIVLVTARLDQVKAARDMVAERTIISVGGVACVSDVKSRLLAGANLVQVHSAFVAGGADTLRAMAHGAET